MLGSLGTSEIIVIILVVLLIFGGKRIPELARGLGRGVSEFKAGLRGEEETKKPELEDKRKGQ